MSEPHPNHLQSSSIGAHRAGVSREKLVRLIQTGEVAGECIRGRYYADERSLDAFIRRTASKRTAKAGQ